MVVSNLRINPIVMEHTKHYDITQIDVPSERPYHLNLSASQVGNVGVVYLCGDPGRVDIFRPFFSSIKKSTSNREFYSIIGKVKNKDVLVLSTGIGPDNIEIVLNEIAQIIKPSPEISLIRIGTCGIIDEKIKPGSFIFSALAIGLDNLHLFYKNSSNYFDREFTEEIQTLPLPVKPYGVSSNFSNKISSENIITGITVTAPGFYAPQGRNLLVPSTLSINTFFNFSYKNLKVLNFEMECSFLYLLGKMLGFTVATFCVGIFNRITKEKLPNYKTKMQDLIATVIDMLN